MKIDIKGNIDVDEKTRRYTTKVIGSLDSYIPKERRDAAMASVTLNRVDRPYGNKYEVAVTIHAVAIELTAKDSTLNVLAALDIVRRKIAIELKNGRTDRLPRRKNRV